MLRVESVGLAECCEQTGKTAVKHCESGGSTCKLGKLP